MSGFLGYDRHGIDVLRQAMRRAADQLGAVRCHDPAARDSMATVGAARAALVDRWLPVLDGLSSCEVMDGYVPPALAGDDLRLSVLQHRVAVAGWQVVSDPHVVAGRPISAPPAAAALAWRLSTADDVEELLDPAEVTWLAARLAQVAADSSETAAFRAAMTPRAWAELIDGLATQQLWQLDAVTADDLDDHDVAPAARLEQALRALATIADNDMDALRETSPYGAALLLARSDASPHQLAALSAQLLERWLLESNANWPDHMFRSRLTGDVLLRRLAEVDGALPAFLPYATADPALVFATAADRALVDSVAVAATRPGVAPSALVGAAIVSWAVFLHDDHYVDHVGRTTYDGTYRETLGALAAPWLLQFTDWRRGEWGFAEGEGERLLERILTDDGAFARLGAAREAALDGFVASIGTDPHAAVDDLGAISGLLDRIVYDRSVADAERHDDMWQLQVDLAALGLGTLAAALTTGVGLGAATKTGTKTVVERGFAHLARNGSVGWLTPPRRDHSAPGKALDRSHTELIASVATVSYTALHDAGRLPPGTPTPPQPLDGESALDYRHRLEAWRGGLPQDARDDAGLYRDIASTYSPERPNG